MVEIEAIIQPAKIPDKADGGHYWVDSSQTILHASGTFIGLTR
jgi:hypothetical protein